MTHSAALLLEQENGVARLTLNRPTAGNSIDLDLARALMEAAIQCDEDDSIRCVSLSGTGRLFCAGGDIQSFIAAGGRAPALLKELTGYLHLAIARLARMDKPLVTVVNGPAAGAGVGLAALGDIVLAARSAHFTLAYTNIALSPDAGCTWLLPRLIGWRKAQELMFTNRRVGAEEAERIGLITRAVDDDALGQVAGDQLQQMADAATLALGHTRRLLLSSLDASLETHLECEARSISQLGRTPDFREGIDAFRAKGKANFTGRDRV